MYEPSVSYPKMKSGLKDIGKRESSSRDTLSQEYIPSVIRKNDFRNLEREEHEYGNGRI